MWQRFSDAVSAYHEFSIENGSIRANRVGVPMTMEELEAFIGPALQLACAFDEAARSVRAGGRVSP